MSMYSHLEMEANYKVAQIFRFKAHFNLAHD